MPEPEIYSSAPTFPSAHYESDTESDTSSEESYTPVDIGNLGLSNEPIKIGLRYIEAAKLLFTHAKKEEESAILINKLNQLKTTFKTASNCAEMVYSQETAFKTKIHHLQALYNQILNLLETELDLESADKSLLFARDLLHLITEQEIVETPDGDTLLRSTPIKVPEESITRYLEDFENKKWFKKIAKGENKEWIISFFATHQENIITLANAASTNARYLPWIANAKLESTELPTNQENQKLKYSWARLGVASPYKLNGRSLRVRYAKQAIYDVMEECLLTQISNYLDNYADLYENGNEINFPIFLQSLLSPVGIEKIIGSTKSSNYLFIKELSEAKEQIIEELTEDAHSLIVNLSLENFTHHDKTFNIKLNMQSTNNAINWLSRLGLTKTFDNDFSSTQPIVNNVVNDTRRFLDSNRTLNNDDLQNLLSKLERSSSLSLFGNSFGISRSLITPEIDTQLENIKNDSLAGADLTTRIRGAEALVRLKKESYFTQAERTLSKIPLLGWVLKPVLNTISFFNPFTAPIRIYRAWTGFNLGLHQAAAEELALGQQGLMIRNCKSSRDRTAYAAIASHAARRDPSILGSQSKMNEAIRNTDKTHHQEAMGDHIRLIKANAVGHGFGVFEDLFKKEELDRFEQLDPFVKNPKVFEDIPKEIEAEYQDTRHYVSEYTSPLRLTPDKTPRVQDDSLLGTKHEEPKPITFLNTFDSHFKERRSEDFSFRQLRESSVSKSSLISYREEENLNGIPISSGIMCN